MRIFFCILWFLIVGVKLNYVRVVFRCRGSVFREGGCIGRYYDVLRLVRRLRGGVFCFIFGLFKVIVTVLYKIWVRVCYFFY